MDFTLDDAIAASEAIDLEAQTASKAFTACQAGSTGRLFFFGD